MLNYRCESCGEIVPQDKISNHTTTKHHVTEKISFYPVDKKMIKRIKQRRKRG